MVPTGLNYLKINVYDLYVGKLKGVPKDLKKNLEKIQGIKTLLKMKKSTRYIQKYIIQRGKFLIPLL